MRARSIKALQSERADDDAQPRAAVSSLSLSICASIIIIMERKKKRSIQKGPPPSLSLYLWLSLTDRCLYIELFYTYSQVLACSTPPIPLSLALSLSFTNHFLVYTHKTITPKCLMRTLERLNMQMNGISYALIIMRPEQPKMEC